MIRSRTPAAHSSARRASRPPKLACIAFASLFGVCAQASAGSGSQLDDGLLLAQASTKSNPAALHRTAGDGLMPWSLRSGYSPIPNTGGGNLDLLVSSVRTNEVGAALSQFDAGQPDDSLRFGVAGVLPGQRLVLRGKLHASRHHNLLGSQVLPGNRYQVFSEIGLAFRLRHNLSIGAEYRNGPDNNKAAGPFGIRARDGAWKDLYISWSLSSALSLTAAYVDLGSIVGAQGSGRQTGHYLSAEFRY